MIPKGDDKLCRDEFNIMANKNENTVLIRQHHKNGCLWRIGKNGKGK